MCSVWLCDVPWLKPLNYPSRVDLKVEFFLQTLYILLELVRSIFEMYVLY